MDRSYLSRPDVIAASRQFVCVRLTTYENEDEAAFLKSFHITRSGEVENTTFCILSPDGKRRLTRAARGTAMVFGDARRMAESMNRIAKQFDSKKSAGNTAPKLPMVADMRLAINVAACDQQPLVILFAKGSESQNRLEARVTSVAWQDSFIGQFVYVAAGHAKDLDNLEGAQLAEGLLIVEPDRFGQKGKVVHQLDLDFERSDLELAFKVIVAQHEPVARTFFNHVREGQRQGVFWETKLPVTDPMERRARERNKE